MAKRYSKNYSNYILRKKYQYTTKGTIWERDWVTIGAQHQIEKGKRPFFGDSGFLFTDNSFISGQKRHQFGKVVAEWLYGDVRYATSQVNQVEVNYYSDDLRDFAYYGSCVELIRSSIYSIIKWFPACAFRSEQVITYNGTDYYVVSNPFSIDFISDGLDSTEVENPMRYISLSSPNYDMVCKIGNSEYTYSVASCEIKARDKEEVDADVENCVNPYKLGDVTFKVSDGAGTFDMKFIVLNSYGNIVVAENNTSRKFIELRANDNVIGNYFRNLEGFEKLLLRTDTNPLYKNRFLKMFETDNGLRYAYRTYMWPTVNDYCIDITSPSYVAFVSELIETATKFDEMWCDNMWSNMTHESLRNYDWTYTKDFVAGDEAANVDGGNRLEKLIRIYGRVFDDIKRYIDGIKFTTKISYDGFNNMPDAEISDRLNYGGWEIVSTIPYFDSKDYSNTVIDYDFISTKDGDEKPVWFYATNPTEISAGKNDIDFLRSLAMSTKHLFKSKGTINSIDMLLALFGFGSDVDMSSALTEAEYESLGTFEKERYELISEDVEDPSNNVYVKKSPRYEISERYYVSNTIKNSVETAKSKIANIVHYDNISWHYDDPYEGVPFGDVELHGKKYIVPFRDSSKYYKGEFAFQSAGGWCKKSEDTENINDYEETMSYLNVVGDFNSLLTVNTYSLEKAEGEATVPPSNIYYVVNPSDYIEYDEHFVYNPTHFFYIRDIYNPELPNSWKPICGKIVDINDTIDKTEYDALPHYKLIGDETYDDRLPLVIDAYTDYNNLGYAFICGGEIKREYTRLEFESGSVPLGYVYGSDVCAVKNRPPSSGNDYKELTKSDYTDLQTLYYSPSDEYVKIDENTYAKITEGDTELYERAMYLDSIISSNVGNNPHTGYGRYDMGLEYKSYMEMPFKYYVDNYKLPDGVAVKRYELIFSTSSQGLEPYRVVDQTAYDEKPWTDGDNIRLILASQQIYDFPQEISFDEYRVLPEQQKSFYRIDESKLLIALDIENRSDDYDENGHNFNLQNLYASMGTSVYDYIFNIDEYITENKVKCIADIYNYADAYTKTITQEDYDKITDEEEKAEYDCIFVGFDSGDPVYEYKKIIDKDTYDAIEDATEKEKYTKTIGKFQTKGLFRDPEDKMYDIPNGEVNTSDDETYYLNNKIITIEFKNTNILFKQYFLDVVGKYLMQVIPSTAIIMILFDCDQE